MTKAGESGIGTCGIDPWYERAYEHWKMTKADEYVFNNSTIDIRVPEAKAFVDRPNPLYMGGRLTPTPRGFTCPRPGQTHIVVVDKTTHWIQFDETESECKMTIQPKE